MKLLVKAFRNQSTNRTDRQTDAAEHITMLSAAFMIAINKYWYDGKVVNRHSVHYAIMLITLTVTYLLPQYSTIAVSSHCPYLKWYNGSFVRYLIMSIEFIVALCRHTASSTPHLVKTIGRLAFWDWLALLLQCLYPLLLYQTSKYDDNIACNTNTNFITGTISCDIWWQ